MKIHKAEPVIDYIEWVYESRKGSERRLIRIEYCSDVKIQELEEYTENCWLQQPITVITTKITTNRKPNCIVDGNDRQRKMSA